MNSQLNFGMSFGISTSVFGHRDSLSASKIKSLEQTGIEWLEIGALQAQHISVFDQQHLDEIAHAVEESSLKAWSLHAPFCGFAMDDRDTRRHGIRRLIFAGRAAALFGAKYIVVHPGRDVPIVNRSRELQWCRDALRESLEHIPDNVTLALETMCCNGLACPPDEIMSVVDDFDSSRVGICFDCGHVNLGYNLTEYIQTVGDRIVTLHLHDNDGHRDAHAMPGEGIIHWPELIHALLEAGYQGVWMCEAGMQNTAPADIARKFVLSMTQHARSS